MACHSLLTYPMPGMCREELSGVVCHEYVATATGRDPDAPEGHAPFLVHRGSRWLATHAPTSSRHAQALADHNFAFASSTARHWLEGDLRFRFGGRR